MAKHRCFQCMRCVVFALNFIVWLAGMTLLGMAIYLRMDSSVLRYIRAGFADDVDSFFVLCYLLVGAGAVLSFVGFMGCCAAFLEFRCLVGSFFILLIMVFAVEIGIAVWVFIHRDGVTDSVASTFKSLIQEQYEEDQGEAQIAVDHIHVNLQCCGASGPSDWFNSSWATNHGFYHKVPVTCCKSLSFPKGYDAGVCGKTRTQSPEIHSEGCLPKLLDLYQERFLLAVYASVATIGIQFLSLVSSMTICCCMRRESHGGYK